jgi:hypothetical protein
MYLSLGLVIGPDVREAMRFVGFENGKKTARRLTGLLEILPDGHPRWLVERH